MRINHLQFAWIHAILAGVLLSINGCKQAPEMPAVLSPYKIDIQQGNIVTQEMLAKLKAGMTRSQVRFVLGSPLVIDPFRGDRWDYVSTFQKQGKDIERRRLTVIFEEDKLIRIEGDVTLSDSSLAPEAVPGKPPAAEKPPVKAASKPVEPAPPAAKPAVVAPVTVTPEPAKVVPAPPPAVKAEPAKPMAASVEKSAQPATDLPPAAASKPAASKPDAAGEPPVAEVPKTTSATADDKKGEAARKDAPKEKPKPGFFGRMLDKLGI